jgi:aminopeptidase N
LIIRTTSDPVMQCVLYCVFSAENVRKATRIIITMAELFMRTDAPVAVYLKDYTPPPALIDAVDMTFELHPTETRVITRMAVRPNPDAPYTDSLNLVGDGIVLACAPRIEGVELAQERFAATLDSLIVHNPPQKPFTLEIVTSVNPTANTQLMGLYRTSGNYCTQCEPEGFRRITYFLDRPDVLSTYIVRIEADKSEAPVLLANGNKIESGNIGGTDRHYAVWHDPFPKPSYLFALVAGDLAHISDCFTTSTGRAVELAIYTEHGKQARAHYAMDALKRSMRWDETAFGRAYDLDVFNIVAVSDFNMGAMENKGLNIFNDKYVLASPETATDGDYAGIESVIAHEYFHNWTGNRITCRDWFQLCLKEGLTVFRDQEFSSDERSRAVKRISDVRVLRGHQFTEDAGPFAHSVRPESYKEINNFYTATIYEKGAEIIRMLRTLIGPDQFRRGTDLYFERHDGQACTMEQFIACFADVSGQDFSNFMIWYAQAGTPQISAKGTWDASTHTYTLDVTQNVPATPGQPHKVPALFPLVVGLLGANGDDLTLTLENGTSVDAGVLVMKEHNQRFVFKNIGTKPVLSINRGFSAPVHVINDQTDDELLFLAAHDSDTFNRWQALQSYALRVLVKAVREGRDIVLDSRYPRTLETTLTRSEFDSAYLAHVLALPSESDIAQQLGKDIDPDAIQAARRGLKRALAHALMPRLERLYQELESDEAYTPDAASAGKRSLRAVVLDYLTSTKSQHAEQRAFDHYTCSSNMTDRMAGLGALMQIPGETREKALSDFYDRFQHDALVIDKWFALQASLPEAETLDRVRRLMEHPAFTLTNPNRVRSLIGMFAAGNATQFNRLDGTGYAFVTEMVLQLDRTNPQVASRLMGAFKSWRMLEPVRRAHAEAALRKVAAAGSLSADVEDLVSRALAED